MKRLYVILFVVIAVAALLGVAISEHSGYVLVAYKSFRYEAGLWVTLALITVIWLLWRAAVALVGLVVGCGGINLLAGTLDVSSAAPMVASMVGLGYAMRTLPVGTAYAVWVGIGATGAAVLGIVLFREPLSPARALFLPQMYGNQPACWDEALAGPARWRFIINGLTRMRYCSADGSLDFHQKGAPGSQPPYG